MQTFTIKATIPTTQYGNLQPEIPVEAETFAEAQAIAMPQIEALWAKYCSTGSELKPRETNDDFVLLTSSMCDNQTIWFSESSHTYKDDKGRTDWMSGSKFAHKYVPSFDKANMLPVCAKAWGVTEAEVAELWSIKGESSTSFGTGIHKALEMYGKYFELGKVAGAKKGINTALHDQPTLEKIVLEFFKGREKENALYEAFMFDPKSGRLGQSDRVLIVDATKKICRIQDFKTNADVSNQGQVKTLFAPFTDMANTPLNSYWLQMSFYASIVEKYGWTVEGLDVFAYTDKWTTYSRKPLKLEEGLF